MILGKVIMIGDSGVGKTSIQRSYIDNEFEKSEGITIGVEFNSKIVDVNNQQVKLHIWDTAGQQVFRSVTRSYYSGAEVAMLVFDIRNNDERIQYWIDELKSYMQEIPIILVANKSDLIKYDVSPKRYERFGYPVFIVSAKTRTNLDELFDHIATVIVDRKMLFVEQELQPAAVNLRNIFKFCWPWKMT